MNYSFHPEAEIEFNQAVDYYETCQAGLGLAFAKEVFSTVQRILEHPHAWSRMSENTRRCLTNRFPFGVIYQIVENEVIVLAVMQLNRRPNYWGERADRADDNEGET